jgi:protein-disulfide isomerase
MKLIVDTYAKDGQAAWVFRHMPIIQLHPQAATLALASECVAQEAGNSAFWNFADAIFELQDESKTISQEKILGLVDKEEIDRSTFVECMRESTLMRRVETDFEEVIKMGGTGTPFTVVISPQQRFTFPGMQKYTSLARAIERVLPLIGADTILPPSADHNAASLFDTPPVQNEEVFLLEEGQEE